MKLKKIYFQSTDSNFFQHVTVNTLIIFFGLTKEACIELCCESQKEMASVSLYYVNIIFFVA